MLTRVYRHAVSLDERRANFVPSLWNHSLTKLQCQDVREVWFKGQHCDIGGGADEPKSKAKRTPPDCSRLSNITLRWMIRQCMEADTIVVYDHRAMDKYRGPAKMVLESNRVREELIGKEELQRKKLEKETLVQKGREKINLSEAEEEKIKKNQQRDKNYAAEKRAAIPIIRESRRGAFVESALLDRRDVVHEPFDAMKKHPSWHVLEYFPLPRRIPTESGFVTTHRSVPPHLIS